MILFHGKFHPLIFWRYFKYGLVVCIFPLLRALFAWDFAALLTALLQNTILLGALSVFSCAMYLASRFTLTEQELCIERGVFLKSTIHQLRSSITVVEQKRTPLQRICGATEVTVYLSSAWPVRRHRLLLWKKDAEQLRDLLMPADPAPAGYRPCGVDKMALTLFSVNLLTTVFFLGYTAKQFYHIFGLQTWELLRQQIRELESVLSVFLPAGLSLIISILFLLSLLSLLHSMFKVFHFKVQRSGRLLLTSGGFFTQTHRRILLSAVTLTDVRLTPTAFLLRRRPLYLEAGGFRGDDLPFLIYKPGEENTIRELLPFFTLPESISIPERRPIGLFFWRPATLTVLVFLMWLLSLQSVPAMAPPLALALLFCLGWIWSACYAYSHEGFCKNRNCTLSFYSGRLLTFHLLTCYSYDISLEIRQSSLSAANGWCHLRLYLPSRRKMVARSVPFYLANRLKFIL